MINFWVLLTILCAVVPIALLVITRLIRLRYPKWQNICSAPKDGTHILLFTKGYTTIRIGWFYNNAWHWDGDYEGVYLDPPTHWQPISPPPKDE